MLTILIAASILACIFIYYLGCRAHNAPARLRAYDDKFRADRAAEQSRREFDERVREKYAQPSTPYSPPMGRLVPKPPPSRPSSTPARRVTPPDDTPSHSTPSTDYTMPSFDYAPSYESPTPSIDTSSTDSGSFSSGGGDTAGGGSGSDW